MKTNFQASSKSILVISLYQIDHKQLWRKLAQHVKLKHIYIMASKRPDLRNKRRAIKELLISCFKLEARSLPLQEDQIVIVTGFAILPFLISNFFKLRKLEKIQIYVIRLFFHSQISMNLYGTIVKLLLSKKIKEQIKFIVFSKADIPMYKKYFSLEESRLVYIPFSKGDTKIIDSIHVYEGDYCFAGGYSNRDYTTLINAFAHINRKLIICCSRHNRIPTKLPNNVEVFYDLSLKKFYELAAGAKLCILPLHDGGGASGQLVTLHYMLYGKPIIATRVLATTDYLNEENASFVSPGNSQELAYAVQELDSCSDLRHKLGSTAKRDYFDKFHCSLEQRLLELITA